MDVSTTPVAERIARVLAGQRISANAGGSEESASVLIDASDWASSPIIPRRVVSDSAANDRSRVASKY